MSDIAIRVDGLGKQYRIGKRERYRTLRDTITDVAAAPYRKIRSLFSDSNEEEDAPSDQFWALKDVSFEVPRGSVVGVIGRNGAGKSTLLKVLSRITEPTEGRVEIHGRVGSLLEVGTGFHPELTGRENISLNGAILGMRRAEIARKFDEIVAFAEIDKFIDTPVKHYSSGMYMRLAFAVAAHLEPEILIVDEVLAVGDAQFQKKCLGKMGDVAKEGRTVAFVSHNMTALLTLCETAFHLDGGLLVNSGATNAVISAYLSPQSRSRASDVSSYPDDAEFRLLDFAVEQDARKVGPFTTSDPLTVRIDYEVKRPLRGLRIGFDVMAIDGATIFRSFDDDLTEDIALRDIGRYSAVCQLPAHLFYPKEFIVSLSIGIHNVRWMSVDEITVGIEFYNHGGVGSAYSDESGRPGHFLLGLPWHTAPLKCEALRSLVSR